MLSAVTVVEEDTARLDRSRDLRGWMTAPLVTLGLAPALTISIGILVAESSTAYPEVCDAAATTNGCQETIFAILTLQSRIFFAGWLLLWALPWWRGLRRYRNWAAVAVGAVLIAAPLRFVSAATLDGMFSMYHWDEVFRGEARSADELSHLSVAFAVTALVIVALPAAGILRFAVTRRPWAAVLCAVLTITMLWPGYEFARLSFHASDQARRTRVVPDTNHPCQMHSGSHDVCPGG
jgi:hypothetical protein